MIQVQRLGWTLLHFLWQGTAIAAVYAMLRSLLQHSRWRYGLACSALGAMVAAPPSSRDRLLPRRRVGRGIDRVARRHLPSAGDEGGRDPYRVIIDAKLRCDPRARVFTERSNASTILVTSQANYRAAHDRFGSDKTEILGMKTVARKFSDEIALAPLLEEFGQRGWNRIMLEGGAHLAASALRQKVADRIAFFVAPKILGGGVSAIEGLGFQKMKESLSLEDLEVWQIGNDLLIESRIRSGAERIARAPRKVRKESMRVNAEFAAIERDPNV